VRALIFIASSLALIAASLTGCGSKADGPSCDGYRYSSATRSGTVLSASDRRNACPVSGTLLGGDSFVLSEHFGTVVVLNFWGAWCPPCQLETPQFDQIYRDRKDEGVLFVGMDVKDPRSNVESFVKAHDISYPVVYDPNAKTALQLGNVPMRGLPSTVVIDRAGRVAGVYPGIQLPADLNPVLDVLVAES
jgi:peroxiredoxin